MAKPKILFYGKSTCSTCRKAKRFLVERGAELEERDLGKQPMTEAEIDALIGERSHLEFLNPRNEIYRARKMKTNPPTREQAVKMMVKEPNLIRRPIVRRGSRWVLGFDEEQYASLLR